jgi:hypothetical protein
LPRHLQCAQFEVLLQQLIIVFPGPKVISFRESQSYAAHVLSLSDIINHSQLFGADDEADGQDLDEAEKNGENGEFLILSNQESTTNCVIRCNSRGDSRIEKGICRNQATSCHSG